MDHLLQAAVRSLPLAAVAALGLWRVKSASVKHAVWTLVMVSMLIQIALAPLLPEIPLRVLGAAEPVAISVISQDVPGAALSSVTKPHAVVSWAEVAAAVYFCGLLFFIGRLIFALLFARRLVRASELACSGAYQSVRISAPVTIGRTILLPMSWSEWDPAKLHAVLAHEAAHVRRHDWAIAAMARLNQCLFWFHPLAWWLERQLARLAEQACDDEALALVQDRQQYAQALLDIARTIHFSKGRLLVVSMAKEVNVETRIDRILDETRQIPKAFGRRGWMALAVLAAPLIYMAAAIQLAPAQTVAPPLPPPPPAATVAQTPAPPEPPAPPQPLVTQPPLDQASRAREIALQEAQKAVMEAQQAQSRNDLDRQDLLNDLQRQMAAMEAAMKAEMAYSPLPQPAVEKFPSAPRAHSSADSSLRVGVTSLRITRISIPLDASGQFLISGQIATAEGKFVMSFDERADYRAAVEKDIPLRAGSYRLTVLVKNQKGGKISKTAVGFEVE